MKITPAMDGLMRAAKSVHMTTEEKDAVSVFLRQYLADANVPLALSDTEKFEGRDALEQFMHHHPVIAQRPSWFDVLASLCLSRISILGVSACFIAVGTGSVMALASEGAIPGDVLYPVKVEVMEPLRERFLRTSEERAAWQVRKIERRMGEAKTLLARGKLTDRTRAVIERHMGENMMAIADASQWPDVSVQVATEQLSEDALAQSDDASIIPPPPEWERLREFVHTKRDATKRMVRDRMRREMDIAIRPSDQPPAAVMLMVGDHDSRGEQPTADASLGLWRGSSGSSLDDGGLDREDDRVRKQRRPMLPVHRLEPRLPEDRRLLDDDPEMMLPGVREKRAHIEGHLQEWRKHPMMPGLPPRHRERSDR